MIGNLANRASLDDGSAAKNRTSWMRVAEAFKFSVCANHDNLFFQGDPHLKDQGFGPNLLEGSSHSWTRLRLTWKDINKRCIQCHFDFTRSGQNQHFFSHCQGQMDVCHSRKHLEVNLQLLDTVLGNLPGKAAISSTCPPNIESSLSDLSPDFMTPKQKKKSPLI